MTVIAERALTIRCGPVVLDVWRHRLHGLGVVDLSPREARIMGVLLDRRNGALATYAEIAERVWDEPVSRGVISTSVRLLRERAAEVGVEIGCEKNAGLYLYGEAFDVR